MMNFTPQERRILIFLVTALLIGSAVSLYRHHRSPQQPEVSVVSGDLPDSSCPPDSSGPGSGETGGMAKIDVNTATREQLQSLPGIGPSLAQRIVEHRDLHGPFATPQEITAVRGIGQKTYERFDSLILVGSTQKPPEK